MQRVTRLSSGNLGEGTQFTGFTSTKVQILAVQRVTRPSSGNLGDTPYVMFGNAQGFYQFTVPAGSPTREVWFIGVQVQRHTLVA